ncbi:recombinase family protein [Adlercreutzia sp. ZJ242]|uniref:recombinase family protein n=1 Tax=Adlercreutzia sp. ZJ242 TaxID=2709409 RepID=UPI0013ECA541|nr:recombinase family protein [Adlercreutzia sp. ZJ242]
MTVYGYVRVSTREQNEERQLRKMRELGVSEGNLYVDKASGKNLDREAYDALMSVVSEGDVVLVDSLDRLGRNYFDIVEEWRRLTREEGVGIRCLDLDFFDSAKFREMGSLGICVEDMLLSLLAYVAQTERDKNRQRQAEGIAIAKEQGKYKGRSKAVHDAAVVAEAERALREGGKAAAARVLGVGRGTVYNMIEDGRLRA